jgi:hypothetical protein
MLARSDERTLMHTPKARNMRNEILLPGPVRTGKSTLGGLLSQQLGMPQVSLDEKRWRHCLFWIRTLKSTAR